MYKEGRDFQVLSLELINSASRFSLFQYEFNRGVLELLLAMKNATAIVREQLSVILLCRVSGWQLVTRAMTALALSCDSCSRAWA